MKLILDGIVGAATGVLSGFGVGGGTLLILYLTMFADTAQRTAQGINLLYFLPTAGASLIGHVKNRMIEPHAFWFAGICGSVTCAAASFAIGQISTDWVKRGFGVFLIVVGLHELFSRKSG